MSRLSTRILFFALFLAALPPIARAQAANPAPSSHRRFPYAFSNFVWWSDDDLRSALKKRIPSLSDELVENSQEQARVRTTLSEMLKEKGVSADVQTIDPPYDLSSFRRVPNAPPVAIVFTIAGPPDIVIDKAVLDNPEQEVSDALSKVVARMQGRPYEATHFWFYRQSMEDALSQLGYLSAAIAFQTGSPRKENDRYLVSLNVVITPGSKYIVSTVEGDGGPLFEGKDLSPYFSLKPGDVATPYAFGSLMGSLRSTYWHAGYAEVELLGDPVLNPAHASASYRLTVNPGPIYHLRSVKLENLTMPQETQARDILALKAGDIYDILALVNLSSKLAGSSLQAYSMSYATQLDKQAHVVDLTLSFYKK